MSVSINTAKAVPPGLERSNKVKHDDHPGNKVKEDHGSNKVKDVDSPASAVAKSRANLNSAIVQTTMNVSLNAGNAPLALLLKSAINGINEELQPTLGKDAIQNAAASQDNSPEATAERILSLSTGFYDAYREQHKLEDNAASREQFIGVIRGGFEKGFKEAQQVLEGLKVLGGEVSKGIDKTFALVMKGYDDFIAGPQTQAGGPGTPPEAV
jgi:uncharacterized phage infection (PIP) family protein YhgE